MSEIPLSDMLESTTNHGASGAFVAVLATDAPDGGRHWPRRQVRRAMRSHGTPRGAWGGFLTALWDGDVRRAWRSADGDNADLLRAAGVPRRHELTPRRAP